MTCPTCQAPLATDARFCPRCGAKFPHGPPPPSQGRPADRQTVSAWREGLDVVIRQASPRLPASCIRCGRPAAHRITKKLYWHSPWAYVAVLINVLVYAIIAAIVRKSITLEVPLCEEHRAQRQRLLRYGWLSLAAAVVLPFVVAAADAPGAAVAFAAAVPLILAVVLLAKTRLLIPRYIDAEMARVRGGCEEFLQAVQRPPLGEEFTSQP